MDEELIDSLGDALAGQMSKACNVRDEDNRKIAILAVLDDILAIAEVINQYQPTYDLRYFYKRCGFPEPYPEHPITTNQGE